MCWFYSFLVLSLLLKFQWQVIKTVFCCLLKSSKKLKTMGFFLQIKYHKLCGIQIVYKLKSEPSDNAANIPLSDQHNDN